jgi:membrane-bound lytic murein transglycosylase B
MLVPAGVAQAESAVQAQAAADAVAAKVHALQPRVDHALRSYQRALNGLASSVTQSVTSEETASAAEVAAVAAADDQTARVRALYMDGGQLGLVSTLLSAQSPGDLVSGLYAAQVVLGAGHVQTTKLRDRSRHARTVADQKRQDATRTISTLDDVQRRYTRLVALLDAEQADLDRLSSRARHLKAAEQAAAELAAARAAATSSVRTVAPGQIPPNYLALYHSGATTCPGLDWSVLAAIGQVESGHGSNVGPSSSGAEGPMQFMPSTFAAYAVDGDGDGTTDIWSPADSIYTAAHYLCANGAGSGPVGLHFAIFRYNHAEWYVSMVLSLAQQIASRYPS